MVGDLAIFNIRGNNYRLIARMVFQHKRITSRNSHPRRIRQRGVEEMAIATINETVYGKLLARTLPRVIKTEKENERMVAD